MPVIKVWLLPENTEEWLLALYEDLWGAIERVPELDLTQERPQDATILFPKDHLVMGLGEYLLVEVTRLLPKPERTEEVLNNLARELGEVILGRFPGAKLIEVFAGEGCPSSGFWKHENAEGARGCDTCGSIEHMQSVVPKKPCPGCGTPLAEVGK